jgi:hypothetical protein
VDRSTQHLAEVGARTELMQLLREAVDDVRVQAGTMGTSPAGAVAAAPPLGLPLGAPRVSSARVRRSVMSGGRDVPGTMHRPCVCVS